MDSMWLKYPDAKPKEPGEYLVTMKRPTAGRWVAMAKYDGDGWTQKGEVRAWMPKPAQWTGETAGLRGEAVENAEV